jgi:hypothetical protein
MIRRYARARAPDAPKTGCARLLASRNTLGQRPRRPNPREILPAAGCAMFGDRA